MHIYWQILRHLFRNNRFLPGIICHVYVSPFPHSCEQRHQLEAWVDRIKRFVSNWGKWFRCPRILRSQAQSYDDDRSDTGLGITAYLQSFTDKWVWTLLTMAKGKTPKIRCYFFSWNTNKYTVLNINSIAWKYCWRGFIWMVTPQDFVHRFKS